MKIYVQSAISLALSCALVFAPGYIPDFIAYFSLIGSIILSFCVFVVFQLKKKEPNADVFKNVSIRICLTVVSVSALVAAGFPKIAAFCAVVSILLYSLIISANKDYAGSEKK